MTPLPPAKTDVRLRLVPARTAEGLAMKLVIDGAGLTVTVAVWVMAVPVVA